MRLGLVGLWILVAGCSDDSAVGKQLDTEAKRPACDVGEASPTTHPEPIVISDYPLPYFNASEYRAEIEKALPGWFCDLRDAFQRWPCRFTFGRKHPGFREINAAQERVIAALGLFPLRDIPRDHALYQLLREHGPAYPPKDAIQMWSLKQNDAGRWVATITIPKGIHGRLLDPESLLSLEALEQRWRNSSV